MSVDPYKTLGVKEAASQAGIKAYRRLAKKLHPGSALDVTTSGTRDGQVLRLRSKGAPGRGGGPAGDALIEVGVRPDPLFERRGNDIYVELPISLREAVLGGKIDVPTPTGSVTMTLPPWSNTGHVMRIKGKGVPRPDGSVAVVLHLIDQVYGLRLALAVLVSALSAQPTGLRLRIASDVRIALDERTQSGSPEAKPASGNRRADIGARCRERRFT